MIVANIFYYIDDVIPNAPTAWEGWCASRKNTSPWVTLCYRILGGNELEQSNNLKSRRE